MGNDLVEVAENSAKGSFFLFSGTAGSTIIMAIASILVARFLGPELYGQYTLVLVVPQLLFIFTDLGINQGITKFTAELHSKDETGKIAQIIKCGLLLKASTGIAIFIINYVFADIFASLLLQRPDLTFYIKIASISILFQVLFAIATSAFIGIDKTEYTSLTTNIQALAKTIISITLVLLGLSVTGAIIGYVAGYAIAAAIGIFLLLLIFHKKHTATASNNFAENVKILIRYGAPLYISAIITGFIPLFNNLILAFFTTDIDIGNYKAAVNFVTLLLVISSPITTALLPAFSKLNSNTRHRTKAFFKLTNKYTSILIIPSALLIIMLSNEIVQIIYGTTFQSAPLFLELLCLVYLLVGLGYLTLTSFYNGIGETKITLRISAITVLILFVLSPLLASYFRVEGVIIAFLVANTVAQVYSSYYAKAKFSVKFDSASLIKIYMIAGLSSLFPLAIVNFLRFPLILEIIAGGAVYFFLYLTLMPLARIIPLSELNQVSLAIQNIRLLALIAKPIIKYQKKILHLRASRRN